MSEEVLTLWKNFLEKTQTIMNMQTYNTWFAPIRPVSLEKNTLVLEVPNRFFEEWLMDHYRNHIQSILFDLTLKPLKLEFTLTPIKDKDAETVKPKKDVHLRRKIPPVKKDNLNTQYTFDNFVVGPSNRFAYAASLAVADSPAESYNPLFIYGGVGLGKTHLMQSIGQRMKEKNTRAKIAYISSEEFTNQLILSIQNRETIRFRNKYRTVDILLIDDIHFLGGKEGTQEEFFHTFNTLYNAHKQIVLTSDRPPKEISNLEERLVSRFEWGLVTDLQAPDMETRIAILMKKSAMLNLNVSEEICYFLASKIKTNIRTLEGSLIKVATYSSLTGAELSLEMAEEAIQDIISDEKIVTIDMIQKKVADFFDIRIADLTGKKRPRNIAFPRQIAMYLSREMTNASLGEIGEKFGGRDHTTVIHANKTILSYIEKDKKIKKNVSFIKAKIIE